jgi:pyridoxine kinase
MRPAVLSISSQVAYGPVGNSAAVPALEKLGMTVYAVPTIVLSHHPGHARPAGIRIPAADLAAMLDSLLTLGVLDRLSAVLTGYFAANDQIFGVARLIGRLKERNPQLVYLCDPVIGADATLYVPLPVAEAIRSALLPLADIVTPNNFELEWLSGRSIGSIDDVRHARLALGAKSLLAKSLPLGEDRLLTVLLGERGESRIESTRRPRVPHGTGDLLSGLFLGHLLNGEDAPAALARSIGELDKIIDLSAGAAVLDLSILRAVSTR